MLLEVALSADVSSNLIENFGSCLLHIINFSFLNLPPNNYPWILSKYIRRTNLFSLEFFDDDVNSHFDYSKYLVWRRRPRRTSNRPLRYLELKTKWLYCLAQFYLFPPSDKKESNLIEWYGLEVPEHFKDFLFWSEREKDGNSQIRYLEVTTRTAYRVLVSDVNSEFPSWVYWNWGMRPFLIRYPSTYLLHVVTQEIQGNISSTYFVCLYCSPNKFTKEKFYKRTLTDKNILKDLTKAWFLYMNKVPIVHKGENIYHRVQGLYGTFVNFGANEIFSYLNLSTTNPLRYAYGSNSYAEILKALLVNVSFQTFTMSRANKCGGFKFFQTVHDIVAENGTVEYCERALFSKYFRSYKTYLSSEVKFEKLDQSDLFEDTSILLGENPVTFVTCAQRETETVSFTGFLAAFDTPTWICILLGNSDVDLIANAM